MIIYCLGKYSELELVHKIQRCKYSLLVVIAIGTFKHILPFGVPKAEIGVMH